ncbi:PIR Superfamily Protein [Plasmodium ovale curtisi]|uniref:PIR Superfamily Protein n=1 Tax=Plasmodium ovale curtisi TaxID=864141 RepID=A0A1A8X9N8_PLAOA|nr:PIR Superfamily Protein [Plasmodium ovale curtisi]
MTIEDSEITGLPSKLTYYKLDEASKVDFPQSDDYWNYFMRNSYTKDSRNSSAILNVFYYIKKLDTNEIFYRERWNYLYFWLGHKLLENSEKSLFQQVMRALHTVRSSNVESTDKYNDDMFNIGTEEFMNLKKIYDYLQNYTKIKARIDSPGAPCSALCAENDTDNYCKVFNRFLGEYVNEIKELTCTGNTPSEKHEARYLADSGQDRSSAGYGGQGAHSPLGQEGEPRGMSHSDGDVSSSLVSTNAMSTVFPLLGTASLAFFFLKFTPLGPRLHNSIFRKNIIQSNDEEAQEILENAHEFSQTNIEDTVHHIAYHSM